MFVGEMMVIVVILIITFTANTCVQLVV